MTYFSKKIGRDILASTALFDLIKDPVFLMEEDRDSFRYVYANPSALAILPLQNIIGSRIEEVLPPEQSQSSIGYYQKARSSRKPVEFIDRTETARGEFIGETMLNPLLTEDGQCQYILAIIRGVTEKERKKRDLQETRKEIEIERKRLGSLVENNANAVFEFNQQKNFTRINKMVTEVTGYGEEELLGQPIVSFVIETCLEETIQQFDKALKGNPTEFETAIYTKQLQIAEFYINAIPIIIEEQVIGVYVIAKEITESKEMERLLRESEQRYKSLFDNHPHGIFTFSRSGNLESANAGAEKITGYCIEELLANSFKSFLFPEELEKVRWYFHQTLAEKLPQRYELTFLRKNGQLIDLEAMNIPIISNEQLVGIHGIVTDITEIRQAHKALTETKDNLEVFWENSTDPIFFIDMEGDILKVNPAFEETFGFTEEEMVSRKGTIIPKNKVSDQLRILEIVLKGETVHSHETIRITKSGKALNIISSYSAVRNTGKEIVGAIIIYKNVTELKKAEKELQKSQEKYRLITENTLDIITMINLSGVVEYVSPAYEKILGHSSQNFIGSSYTANVHPEDAFALMENVASLINGGNPATVEVRFLHHDGHYIWMEVSPTPLLADGEMKQLFTIARDITERRKLRDKIAEMAFYDHLTGIPNRRTFDDKLKKAMLQADRSGKKTAVLMLDGRKFKQINDQFGHDAGDAVIKEMASRLQACARSIDTAARLGGDEMGVILPELDSVETAENMAKRILKSYEAPLVFNGIEINIGAGIGISLYPDDSPNEKLLLKYADMALYEAKKSDQNEYRIYR